MERNYYSRFLFLLLIFCFPFTGFSTTYYSRASGNWNTASTWSTASCSGAASTSVPGALDNVIICSGKTVTMNGNPGNCLSLTINGTASWSSAYTTNVGSGGLVMAGGKVDGGLLATGKLIVSGIFNVLAGTSTFARATISVTGTTTVTGTINWTSTRGTKTLGDVNIVSGGNFNNSSNEKFTIKGNFQDNGSFTSGTAVYTCSGTVKTFSGSAAISFNKLTCTGSYTNNSILSITNALAGSGSFTQGSIGTLNYSGGAIGVTTFNASAAGNIVNYTMTGNFSIPIPNDGSYSNLRVSSGGTKKLSNNTIVGESLLINTGTILNANSYNLKVGGNFTNNNSFTAGAGTVTLNGTTLQAIGGSAVTTFNNLTLNNSAGATLTVNTKVSGILNFTAGVITTGTFKVTMASTGSVSGAGTSRFVNGFLEKNVATGGSVSRTYEIGNGAINYLPLNLVFTNVTTAGNVAAKVNNGDHPNISTCCIDPLKSVNRYWQLANTGTVFVKYSATCNFIGIPADADAGSTTSSYYMSVFNSGVWNLLTQGTLTSTSTQATGITLIGDLQVGNTRVATITSPPANTTVCNNTNATFSITATNAVSYQWQQNSGSGFVNITSGGIYSGATSAVLSISPAVNSMNTYQYRCIINNTCGSASLTSSTATLTVTPNVTASITISASPSTTICSGTNVTFTAHPTNGGTTPVYQWKVNGVNVGTNSPTYSSTTLTNGNLVTCVLTSNATCVLGSPVTSNTLTITVNPSLPASVSITATATTICAGTSVTFTAHPINGGTTPAYQWKKNGVNIAGATSVTFSSTTLSNGDIITCILTSNLACVTGSPVTSASITMTVNPIVAASVSISVSPSNTICAGTNVTFTATPINGGTTPTYQWKRNGTNIAGATSATFSSTTLTNGNIITCVVTSTAACVTGSPATSGGITMTVNPSLPVSVNITSTATTVCVGTNVTFTAHPTNGGTIPVYQWKLNGVNVGTNSVTFASTTLANGDLVTCELTSNATCGTGSPATSNTITMTVNPNLPVSVTITATSTSICPLTNVTFTAVPINGGPTPGYHWKKNGVTILGATSATYSSATLTNGNIITCVLTSTAPCAVGSPATSNAITMTVGSSSPVSVSISASPSSTICSGSSVTFTAIPVNGGTLPGYQWKKNGANIAGATSATYTSAALLTGNIITCVLTSGGITCGSGSPATSNAITMTVNSNLPVSVSIAASPSSTICSGSNVTFTATPVNGGTLPGYQWKKNGVNIAGAVSATFSSTTLLNGDIIACVLTSNATCATGNPATSGSITMTVNPSLPVAVSIVPSPSSSICSGTNVTFTATPTNGGTAPVYQWQLNGVNVGINSSTYSNSGLTNGNIITCVLASNATCAAGSPATSNTITMTVSPNLPVNVSVAASPSTIICLGTNVTFTAIPTNGGTTPSYQWKLNGVNAGSNSPLYSDSTIANGDVVNCVLTSNATCATGNPATSGSTTMTVNPNLPVSILIAASPSITICSGTNVTFTATPTNGGSVPVYQWQLNGINVGSNSATYSNSGLADGDVVNCILTSNSMCIVDSSTANSNPISMHVTLPGTWLGTVSTDWNNSANWCGGVPAITTNVLIPVGTPFSPILTNNSNCRNINISAGATFNAGSYSLNVKGNWINNGTFNQGTGTVIFDGATLQTMSATSPTTFNNLTINNSAGVTISSGVYNLDGVLNINNGDFSTGGNNFTMTSTATNTARIAPITGTGVIAGNFIVQRFISTRDTSYSDLSSPVQNSTFEDWDNELPAISYYSAPPTEEPSAYTYNETADVYVSVTSPATPLNPGQGFEVFLSGGYSYTDFPATTINTIGVPNQGDQDLSGLISNNVQGWNLVGNPFASSIAWSSIYTASGGASSGLYDYIEMYDYTIGDWHGYTSADGIQIGSTQGFWVYGLPGANVLTLIVPESSKTTATNSSIKSLTVQPYFTLRISDANGMNSYSHTFKIAEATDASDGLDNKDIPFRTSPNKMTPEIYSAVGDKKVNYDVFNANDETNSIPLKTTVGRSGNYKIEAGGFDFVNDYSCILLEDKLKNKFINLREQNSYQFGMNPSDDADRFVIHFNKSIDCGTNDIPTVTNIKDVNINDEVKILTTRSGNLIDFNFSETTNAKISVVNMLGQNIVSPMVLPVSRSSENVDLPSGFNGLYIVKIESEKGTYVKRFFKQ